MDPRYKQVQAVRIREEAVEIIEDTVVTESPLTVYFNGEELVTLLCTWEYTDELAVGFLHSEGFIKTRADIDDIRVDHKNGTVTVTGRSAVIARQTFLKRYITTGCGKGTSFYHLTDAVIKPVAADFKVASSEIHALMLQAQRRSDLFKTTGGVHSSAICSRNEILFFREDIGRHNTVDKLIGRCLLDDIETGDKILITTGRISSEILIKTANTGISVIASRSAPTELAVRHAGDLGVTVAAFVRGGRMNIYTHHERIMPRGEK